LIHLTTLESNMKRRNSVVPKQKSASAEVAIRASVAGPIDPVPEPQRQPLIALFNARHYGEMEAQAQLLIEQYPDSGFAWQGLSASQSMQGKPNLPALEKAAELLSQDLEAQANLGNALMQLGRFEEAIARFGMALKINSDHANTHSNLGIALTTLGRQEDGVVSFRRALQSNPNHVSAHYNLGNALKALGQLQDAQVSYQSVLQLKPDHANAHAKMGDTLKGLGQREEAVASYLMALHFNPAAEDVCNNLGNTLLDLRRTEDAVAIYHRALQINPGDAEAHANLGVGLRQLGLLEEAVASYQRALELRPDYAEAYNNLGNAQQELGRFDDAVASYWRAIGIKPDYAEVHNNLGNALKILGRLEDAMASYRQALQINPDLAYAQSNLIFAHNYLAGLPADGLLSEARRYGEWAARRASPYHHCSNVPDPTRGLRVGLVSGDLRNHVVSYFLEGVITVLAKDASDRLELFAYSNHTDFDVVSERIKARCSGWSVVAGLSDHVLAERIREDRIDILIDLSGHTAHNRLPMFARKPAPVQVSWLGYFATTGVAQIDYLIADPLTLPPSEEAHFTERVWRLPETRLCFTPPDVEVSVSALPALATGEVTFACFNNLTKMNDAVVALWARVLDAVAGSRLFLKAKQLGEPSVQLSVLDRFGACGIQRERLILEGESSRQEYFEAYHRVDIALDPFPFTGGTTTAESLWMGVPVLTRAGERFVSRQGVGLLTNAGLPDWVALDTDDYLVRAVKHAADLESLAHLRSCLRQQVLNSPIFDAERFAEHFEAALRGMWIQWCNAQAGPRLHSH
jgi:predicted O-linked N-acetylglucosamine transferase (SPINDLY family)